LWLLHDRSSGALIGRGGLQHTWVTGRKEVEVAWAIVPELWGRGLATESARASISAAFGPLNLPEVIAYTRPDNAASRRVMEKTGFEFERAFVTETTEQVLYRRART
jgi:ribosomal-protein-alanine N-acetyltransferase